MQIYISRDGEQNGPYGIEDVNAYLEDGTLLPTDLACQDGMTEWVPITQIPGVLVVGDSAATPMSSTEIPKHFFISYSRKDELIVKQVVAHLLRVGIDVWIDRDDLTPGTPDWEKSIRTAIDESYGVILLASQNSSQSEYVRGEVSLAESKESRIFPVWIDGNKWIECAPLQLAHTQYIDCRQSSLQSGLEQLDKALFGHINKILPPHFQLSPIYRRETVGNVTHTTSFRTPPGYFRVMLDDSPGHTKEDSGTAAFLRLSDHGCMHSVLDCLWQNYLTDSQPPLSYGSSWVLIEQQTSGSIAPLLIPWSWLITAGTGMHARSVLKERKATVRRRIEELRRLDKNLKLGDQERKVSPSVQAEFGGVELTAKVVRERIPAELEALEIEMPDEALESDAKFNYRPDLNWLQKSSLEACGLKAGSCWEIRPCDFVPVGIAVRDRRIIYAMMHHPKAEILIRELIEHVQIEEVSELCTERVVVEHNPLFERDRPPAGMAIVQSSIEIEGDYFLGLL